MEPAILSSMCYVQTLQQMYKMDNKGSQLEIALYEDKDWNFKMAWAKNSFFHINPNSIEIDNLLRDQ